MKTRHLTAAQRADLLRLAALVDEGRALHAKGLCAGKAPGRWNCAFCFPYIRLVKVRPMQGYWSVADLAAEVQKLKVLAGLV